MKSQTDAILSYLKSGHVLTPLQALDRFGTFRLAARCAELRQRGYDIQTRMVRVRTRAGWARVAGYRLTA